MKSLLPLLFFSVLILFGCHKSNDNVNNNDCGCGSDSVKYAFTNAQGSLMFDSGRMSWTVIYNLPDNISYVCKICNSDIQQVKLITDTLSHSNHVPILFTGKIKQLCPDESNFYFIPESLFYDIVIDSLQKI